MSRNQKLSTKSVDKFVDVLLTERSNQRFYWLFNKNVIFCSIIVILYFSITYTIFIVYNAPHLRLNLNFDQKSPFTVHKIVCQAFILKKF